MTDNKRRNKPTDLDANAPQADGFSWSESQTGSLHSQQHQPRDLDRSSGDGAGVRAPRPEI